MYILFFMMYSMSSGYGCPPAAERDGAFDIRSSYSCGSHSCCFNEIYNQTANLVDKCCYTYGTDGAR